MTSLLYYIQFNKCICNLTSEYSFNCGFKFFLICLTWYILKWYSYIMGNRDLPDIYAHALGPAALGLGHIYIRQTPLAHVITYTYILVPNICNTLHGRIKGFCRAIYCPASRAISRYCPRTRAISRNFPGGWLLASL